MQILRQGSSGPMVGWVQQILSRLDCDPGEIDYIFGPRTAEAVKCFQRKNGLAADGIIGPDTWRALEPYISGNYEYTIKASDTFYEIARRMGITLDSLLAANPTADPYNLQVGQKILVPFMRRVVPENLRYSYQIMQLNISSLARRYPFIETGSAGQSVMGRTLYWIRLGKGKKCVFYNASHHANEWITSLVLMRFTEDFCYSYVNGVTVDGFSPSALYDDVSIYIMPMVNPDGVDLVTGATDKDSPEYKQAYAIRGNQVPFPSGWKANIRGTDLNLNYPALWQTARQIKFDLGYTSPGPRDYVGEAPFSEPESRAVADFTGNISPSLVLAYHSQGEIIYWKFSDYNPENSLQIAQRFSELSGYSVEDTPYNSAFAGYKDWFIQQYNLPGYTIEVGRGTSPLPLSQFSQIYRDNIGILSTAPTFAK